MAKLIILISLIISSSIVSAQPIPINGFPDRYAYLPHAAEKEWLLVSGSDSIVIPNDLFAPDQSDQNYSFGLALNWSDSLANKHIAYKNWFGDGLRDYFNFDDEYQEEKYLQIGLTGFTPDFLDTDLPQFNDRPYANLVYFTTGTSMTKDSNQSISTELTWGIVGSNLGEGVQSGWHDLLRGLSNAETPVKPLGWDNQISDGGELTGKMSLKYHEMLASSDLDDWTWFVEGNIGYHTGLAIGTQYRIGRLSKNRSPNRIDRSSPNSSADKSRVEPTPCECNESQSVRTRESYFFAGIKGSYMHYNGFLQGFSKHSVHELLDSEVKKEVLDVYLGFEFPISRLFKDQQYTSLTYRLNWRSKEHKLAKARNHLFGELIFTWQR